MKPNPIFFNKSVEFWASVRWVGNHLGYAKRGKITVPSLDAIGDCLSHISSARLSPPQLSMSHEVFEYLAFRQSALNDFVQHNLQDADSAEKMFEECRLISESSSCPLPMNKQKGEKKQYAFLTCSVNLLISHYLKNITIDYDPRDLTVMTSTHYPSHVFSRRFDGAIPSTINPVCVWEIKEYYYTTTFGSRIADGVYETQLDGYEIRDYRQSTGKYLYHFLVIDSHYTWWGMGKSYLCRLMDALHMGMVDEILFGREIIERIPDICQTLLPHCV